MAFVPLKFKAGIVSDITPYTNEGGFVDGDKIRFRLGTPEKMGGWSKYSPNVIEGSARRLHNWVALDGSDFMGIGTELHADAARDARQAHERDAVPARDQPGARQRRSGNSGVRRRSRSGAQDRSPAAPPKYLRLRLSRGEV